MTKDLIKILISEYQRFVSGINLTKRGIAFLPNQNYVLVGLRHVGKSYLMYQRILELVAQGHSVEEILYFNFEDDRIDSLTISDLELIKTCYEEMYDYRPLFFLDEIQVVDGWEKFARRLADQKYQVYITGSNAKMLSSEIATTLGGRYMIQDVYPYSLKEYLKVHDIDIDQKNAQFQHHKAIVKYTDEYYRKGGLPETAMMANIRPWMSSLFNKIFFGDIVARYGVRNDFALRVLVRKLAESVKQPISYSRMSSVVSSAGKRLSTDAAIDYIQYMIDSWLLLPFENIYGKLQDKEMNRKYYFTDNGILSLFLVDPSTTLLENIIAVDLRRRYGSETYFFNTPKTEVDFYVPEEKLAIQVSYSMADPDTAKREIAGLMAIANFLDIERLVVVTKDDESIVESDNRRVEIIPLWKWLSHND